MTGKSVSNIIINNFGLNLYQKSLKFLSNKINIIYLREEPIKIRSVILDNEREFHLIIDEVKNEIFHDCPSFWIHSELEKKVCVHLIKLLLIIKNDAAQRILENLNNYTLTSKDLDSKKKSKNFLLLANSCFQNNNCVAALFYLNKVTINQFESETITKTYLSKAIENNLYIEFFEFLKNIADEQSISEDKQSVLFETEPPQREDCFFKYKNYIERGFKSFLNRVQEYSFFNLLKIIEYIDKIFEIKDISFLASEINKLKKMTESTNLNKKYFSIYLTKKNYEKLVELSPDFKEIVSESEIELLKKSLLNYFISEIDNFCIIDKLKLMKKQFHVFNIPKEKFHNEYKKYKIEIKELEKKVYLKKFAFLKVLIEKYNIKKAIGEFKKEKNTYLVKHNEENLKKPVYNYLISHIGFYGLNDQTIKSSEIGINYFIMKELFLDDLSSLQDAYYYRRQFWGEKDDYEVKSIDGLSLLSRNIEYSYDVDKKSSEDIMIIEWDLANKPIRGSIITAYDSQIVIPDQNNPLFHDLKPFDLCYCKKTPVKIESNIIKTINVIMKCSFKDAIRSVSKGMTFIEGYYPLSLIKRVLSKEITPFQANEIVGDNPNRLFIPNYTAFIEAFKEFLFNFILKEKDFIFEELKSNIEENSNLLLRLLNLDSELTGLDLPFYEILARINHPNINLKEFKSRFLSEIHSFIKGMLKKKELGSTIIFDLKKLRNTAFFKYSNEIIDLRKKEFETSKIFKLRNEDGLSYDLSEVHETYYGKKFLDILLVKDKLILKPDKFKKFRDFSLKLKLKLNIG